MYYWYTPVISVRLGPRSEPIKELPARRFIRSFARKNIKNFYLCTIVNLEQLLLWLAMTTPLVL